ncbi:recombinase family protein [Arthrobacter sp. H16F315]|uniref:recombinase family protein n=1 Tax=Arthrobacter sp. H16F315 TaxID=2955314 RepID=UPI0021E671FF|nr:recombinase family protein [Arthrobacter sp. H16F315]MDD1478666.1 recombinase family protein [Arthrobacter sp. H16F315]
MGAFAEFERFRIGERQQEGITLAKALGVYRGRWKALAPREGWRAAPAGRWGSGRPTWPENSASAAKCSTSTSRQTDRQTALPSRIKRTPASEARSRTSSGLGCDSKSMLRGDSVLGPAAVSGAELRVWGSALSARLRTFP